MFLGVVCRVVVSGGARDALAPPEFEDLLTLFQPEGADYAYPITASTPRFHNLTTALVCRYGPIYRQSQSHPVSVSQSVYFNVRIIQSFMFRPTPIHVDIQSSREKRHKMLNEQECCCMYFYT